MTDAGQCASSAELAVGVLWVELAGCGLLIFRFLTWNRTPSNGANRRCPPIFLPRWYRRTQPDLCADKVARFLRGALTKDPRTDVVEQDTHDVARLRDVARRTHHRCRHPWRPRRVGNEGADGGEPRKALAVGSGSISLPSTSQRAALHRPVDERTISPCGEKTTNTDEPSEHRQAAPRRVSGADAAEQDVPVL